MYLHTTKYAPNHPVFRMKFVLWNRFCLKRWRLKILKSVLTLSTNMHTRIILQYYNSVLDYCLGSRVGKFSPHPAKSRNDALAHDLGHIYRTGSTRKLHFRFPIITDHELTRRLLLRDTTITIATLWGNKQWHWNTTITPNGVRPKSGPTTT